MITNTYTTSFDAQLSAYKNQVNPIPETIFLIWIGEDIPETETRPYQSNAIKHKQLNPESTVQILVSKPMLIKSGRWDALAEKFSQHGVILRDIHTTCNHMINFSVVEKLMADNKDYVWASDILRLALIFHEGGWYFDTDLTPLNRLGKVNALYGFLQYHSTEDSMRSGFCFQAGVRNHFIHLFASVISRHFYEIVARDKPTFLNTKFASIRQKTITHLSGFPIFFLLSNTNLEGFYQAQRSHFSFPLGEKCKVTSDCTWLDSYKELDEYKIIKKMGDNVTENVNIGLSDLKSIFSLQVRLKAEGAQLSAFHATILNDINEASLKELCSQYFPVMIKEYASSKRYFKSLNGILESKYSLYHSRHLSPHFWSKPTPVPDDISSRLESLEVDKPMMIYSV